jgi:protein involved in polysaccharide export with SLBB domain
VSGALAGLAACSSAPPAVSPCSRYTITPSEMLEVVGAYPLSNGDVLKVSNWQHRFWAEMRATGRIEIVPVGPGLFVQKDGPVSFQFEELPFTTGVAIGGLDAPVAGGSGIEREFRE